MNILLRSILIHKNPAELRIQDKIRKTEKYFFLRKDNITPAANISKTIKNLQVEICRMLNIVSKQ